MPWFRKAVRDAIMSILFVTILCGAYALLELLVHGRVR